MLFHAQRAFGSVYGVLGSASHLPSHSDEVDTRFAYDAAATLVILGAPVATVMDRGKCVGWLLACRNHEGAFGPIPGSESAQKEKVSAENRECWRGGVF